MKLVFMEKKEKKNCQHTQQRTQKQPNTIEDICNSTGNWQVVHCLHLPVPVCSADK